MDNILFALLALLILALLAAAAYIVRHNSARANPYADFDRWQECFNAGIEARHSGLDLEDNPFDLDARDYDAWLDGWMLAARCQEPHRTGQEVA
jgi:hypothetical protein